MTKGKIFINYRREINLKEAQLLQTKLSEHFGKRRVFLDERLEGGENWLQRLEREVDGCSVMLALICKGWSEIRDKDGHKRLEKSDDFVRFEISRAFLRNISVLPVQIDGAAMPTVAELPSNIAPICFTQAMLLRGESFSGDAEKISERLEEILKRRFVKRFGFPVAATLLGAGFLCGFFAGAEFPTNQTAALASLRNAIEAKQQALSEFEAVRKGLEDEQKDLQQKLSQMEAARRKLEASLSATREDATKQAKQAEQQRSELQQSILQTEATHKNLEAQLSAAHDEAAKLTARIDRSTSETKTLQENLSQTEAARKKLEAQLSAAHDEEAKLTARVNRSANEIETLQESLSQNEAARKSLEAQLSDAREQSRKNKSGGITFQPDRFGYTNPSGSAFADPDAPAGPCDEAAANPYDPEKKAKGVAIDALRDHSQDAIEACRNAVDAHPTTLRFQYQLARAYQGAGNWEEAERRLRALVNSNYLAAYDNLGWILVHKRYRRGGSNEDLQQAIRYFLKAANAGQSEAMLSLGKIYDCDGEHAQAIEWYEKSRNKGNEEATELLNDKDVYTCTYKDVEVDLREMPNILQIIPRLPLFIRPRR